MSKARRVQSGPRTRVPGAPSHATESSRGSPSNDEDAASQDLSRALYEARFSPIGSIPTSVASRSPGRPSVASQTRDGLDLYPVRRLSHARAGPLLEVVRSDRGRLWL